MLVDAPRCLSLASVVVLLGACSSGKPAQLDHAVARDHTLPFIDQPVHDTSDPDVARDLPTHDLKPDLKLVDSTPPDQSKSPAVVGCSDGTREGFLDIPKFSRIAACAGAWSIKGIHNTTPACARAAGNDGTNSAGTGCNVTDLCAGGWHVCFGKVDVLSRNAQGCLNILDNAKSPAFFLARTSSTGAFNCSQDSTLFGDPGTSNDLFGCGDLGCAMVQGTCTVGGANCDPLKTCAGCPAGQHCANGSTCTPSSCYPLTTASHDLCKGLRNDKSCGDWCNHLGKFTALKNDWDCGTSDTLEANNVVKSDPAVQGGVLCCQD